MATVTLPTMGTYRTPGIFPSRRRSGRLDVGMRVYVAGSKTRGQPKVGQPN